MLIVARAGLLPGPFATKCVASSECLNSVTAPLEIPELGIEWMSLEEKSNSYPNVPNLPASNLLCR